MVIEELIARLGFKVDSLAPVEKAINRLDQLRGRLRFAARDGGPLEQRLSSLLTKGVTPFVAAAIYSGIGLKRLQAGLLQTTAAAGRLGPALVRISSRAVGMGQSLGLINSSLIGTRAGMFGVVAAVASLAAGFAFMVGKAAQARKELAIFARTNRTTPQRVDVLTQGLRGADITSDEAQSAVGAIRDQVGKSITDGKGGQLDWLTDFGVSSVEKNGRRIDSSAVLRAFVEAYIKRFQKIKALRDKEKAAEARGDKKGAAAAREELNPLETNLEKQEQASGLGKEFFGKLQGVPSVEEYRRKEAEGASQRPTATKEQEETFKRLSNGIDGLMNRLGGLADLVARVAAPTVGASIDAINGFLDKVATFAKAVGLMNVTKEEAPGIPTKQEAVDGLFDSIKQGILDFAHQAFASDVDAFQRFFSSFKLPDFGKQQPTIMDSGNDNRKQEVHVQLGVLEHNVMAAEVGRQVSAAMLGFGSTAAKIGGTTGPQTTP